MVVEFLSINNRHYIRSCGDVNKLSSSWEGAIGKFIEALLYSIWETYGELLMVIVAFAFPKIGPKV